EREQFETAEGFVKKLIGKTDVSVKKLGFGGAGIAGLYTKVQESDALAAVHEALRLGFDFFDCAPEYGHGRAEFFIGEGVKGQARESFVLSTKVGKLLVPEDPARVTSPEFCEPLPHRLQFDYSFDGVIRSVEESLRRLNLSRVDILHIHDPDDHYMQAITGARSAQEVRENVQLVNFAIPAVFWEQLRNEKLIPED